MRSLKVTGRSRRAAFRRWRSCRCSTPIMRHGGTSNSIGRPWKRSSSIGARSCADLPVLDLPTDYPRPRLQTFAGDMVPLSVPAEVAGRLRRIGGGGTTLYMVLTAAFGVLLARHTRQREVVLGTSVAQRGDGQTHGLIGFLVNMLVIRFELCGEGRFAQLLDRVRDVVVDALAHSDLPYESLVERLQPERDPSRNPLFQVALTLLNAPKPQLVFDGLAVETLANQMRQPVSISRYCSRMDKTANSMACCLTTPTCSCAPQRSRSRASCAPC